MLPFRSEWDGSCEDGGNHWISVQLCSTTYRGLTQIKAGNLARLPRLAVIKIEAGCDTVAMGADDKLANALGAELGLLLRTRPTFEELKDFQ